jgi:hypothetical protein
MQSARALFNGLIDYAGLFPPASLGMAEAAALYARYRSGDDAGFLGRFVAPVARFHELSAAAREVQEEGDRWQVSGIVQKGALDAALDQVAEFESEHVTCDSLEIPAGTSQEIESVVAMVPDTIRLFVEMPLSPNPDTPVSILAGTRAAAKMRAGGVTPDAFPSPPDVIRFMRTCMRHGVPFKATAGLHHFIRGDYPLTYETGSPSGEMSGYANVFLAAALIDCNAADDEALAMLLERDASSVRFTDGGVSWRDRSISADQLARSRERFALSFGSCSFSEPVEEARSLAII